MVKKKPGLLNKLFGAKGASVEKCARIGLFNLKAQASNLSVNIFGMPEMSPKQGLETFQKHIQDDYEKVIKPKLSKWKIGLSIAIPIIPLVNVIISLVKTWLTERTFKKLQKIDQPFRLKAPTLGLKPHEEQKKNLKEWQAKRMPFAKKFFSIIEGVPYKAKLGFA